MARSKQRAVCEGARAVAPLKISDTPTGYTNLLNGEDQRNLRRVEKIYLAFLGFNV